MESGVDKLERSVDNPEIQLEGRDVRDETQSNHWPLWIGAIALCLSVSSCKPDDSPFKAENESHRKQLAKQESVVTSLQDGNKVMQQQIDLLNQELRDAKKSAESSKADAYVCKIRGIEGLMLKRADSVYVAGRPKGPWFKWKRDPMLADCVLMYAQRGHGKRSSFYSDFTFGCWRELEAKRELAPVGKAYFGFTDEELRWLDKWVRDHTTNRFGPVREVEPKLVLEIAFDGIARSTRHKSGVAMRFPRINRIRTDKPANEADTVDNLLRFVSSSGNG